MPKWDKKVKLYLLFLFRFSLSPIYMQKTESCLIILKTEFLSLYQGIGNTIGDESLPDKGYYYSAESTRKNSTGLFNLVTINTEENPVKTLLIQQKNMKEEVLYKDSGIEFTTIENGRFGSMDAKTVNYESVVKGTKVSGTIYCFNCSEKTYLVFFQTGIKDQKINMKVFRMIELTFACR